MADRLSEAARGRIMRAIKSKDTRPELMVRKYLFAKGYRYRLHSKKLPGKPDLVFPGRRKVILVHGCFWHQHANPDCTIRVTPSSHEEYWAPKLQRNIARDAENGVALQGLGWGLLVVWECELRENREDTLAGIEEFLGPA